MLLNISKIILSFLEHPNTKVPYKNFVKNYIFSIFSETTATNATIFGVIGLFLLLNILKMILSLLEQNRKDAITNILLKIINSWFQSFS
jgi:hypothetical protein